MMSPFACAQNINWGDDLSRSNPISKLARVVNPKLVEVENRMLRLDRESAKLARYQQFSLRCSLGYLGHRMTSNSPDPSIVMDFGKVMPLDTIYLIPCQRELVADSGIFPLLFTIELSKEKDFSDAVSIYRSNQNIFRHMDGMPARFEANTDARYLRLSVQRGHDKGTYDVYGLSEIFVFSKGQPVSFNARVITSGDLEISPVWNPATLNDGRCPLGIWHHGKAVHGDGGDALVVDKSGTASTWTIKLVQPVAIDHIVLFPYQMYGSSYSSVFPNSISVQLDSTGDNHSLLLKEWSNPLYGSNQCTPLVFAFDQNRADTITITARTPWLLSERTMHALSEIQVWSAGKNIAQGLPVKRTHQQKSVPITVLTDGDSSESRIVNIEDWLDELIQRSQINMEMHSLRAIHRRLSTRSELNVSWASAVALGLTFLIPVYIFERRRIKSREHLDIIRKRIAADLHDDIGSNLGSISMIARTARKDLARLNGPTEVDQDLEEVELIARESSLAMRDIVWLLERKQDSIGDLVHRMRETAGRLLRGTEFSLDCATTKTTAKLSLDAKRHLFLFYKEAIHNIIKHSQADQVSIRLWDEADKLVLEIMDNGVGLPINDDQMPICAKKLEERAEVMNGDLQIDSASGKGTTIRLLVKRSALTNPSTSS